MPAPILENYAKLLVHYCLDLQPNEKLFIHSTTLAEPLVREVLKEALKAGAIVEYQLDIDEEQSIRLSHSNAQQLSHIPTLRSHAMSHFDAYLKILAPHSLLEDQGQLKEKLRIHQAALKPMLENYSKRTAEGTLKRSLCLYPTQAGAELAGMTLEDYCHFVYHACRLLDADPKASWLAVRATQQHLVDYLNKVSDIRYVGPGTDIRFSVKGRQWMNSDGRTNMPSGEVFTGPVEDSVEGTVYFSFPSLYEGQVVKGIRLTVSKGKVMHWTADEGQDLLDELFTVPGSRYFGEVAIGTNYNIQQPTLNILFDEKIGGTIHMAVGQSYLQTGGTNNSVIHWDMITDMRQGGKIYADGVLIYQDGKFLI